MNTRFIETFVTLAQLGSFRATARALHATPAAISLRIKTLEEELQTELIDRSSKEFRLTPNAEYLLSYAKSVLDATRRLCNAAKKESLVRGRLRLGVIESIVHSWLANYIKRLNASYPELEIDLSVDMSASLEKRLRSRELDMVIVVDGVRGNDILSDALASFPVRWIARKGLLPLKKDGLVRRALEFPFLTFGRGTAPQRVLEEIVENLAAQASIPLSEARMTCSPSVAAIVQLVRDGYGIAAIPSLFVTEYLDSGEFVEVPIQPMPPPIVTALCMHANAEMMVHAAAQEARQVCADFSSQMGGRFVELLC